MDKKDILFNRAARLFHLTTVFLPYKKHVSIFHLPPFRVHIVDCEMYRLVEDAVFMPFIFHPHLPSSTRCFRGYFSSNGLENKWICPISYPLISLKAFHFPYSLQCKWSDLYLSPGMRAHRPGYAGSSARACGLISPGMRAGIKSCMTMVNLLHFSGNSRSDSFLKKKQRSTASASLCANGRFCGGTREEGGC